MDTPAPYPHAPESSEFCDRVEALLDTSSPALLIEALAVVADAKAAHVLANWQDPASAKLWTRIARSLDKEAARLLKIGNPYG